MSLFFAPSVRTDWSGVEDEAAVLVTRHVEVGQNRSYPGYDSVGHEGQK